MSGVMVFASTEELKAEQAAGNQMLDMMAPMLSQLSLGSALVRLQLFQHPCSHPFSYVDTFFVWQRLESFYICLKLLAVCLLLREVLGIKERSPEKSLLARLSGLRDWLLFAGRWTNGCLCRWRCVHDGAVGCL